jgi:hypothetical protein
MSEMPMRALAVLDVAHKEMSRLGYHEVGTVRAQVLELIEAVQAGGGAMVFSDVDAHRLQRALYAVMRP